MIPAPIPADDQRRLDALYSLNILDTAAEERFDRLTRLARRLFDVPIALVSLVDARRQWFKSSFGLAVRETPREQSFCGHAILRDDLLIVPDALQEQRFHDNPLVTGAPGVRFYAGCPLAVRGGAKVGTLCLIDTAPREFDQDDQALLHDLGRLAEQELESAQLASMDDLTMLSNRRGFSALAQHALAVCQRQGVPVTLLFFDGFKAINDRFGHAEGDLALTAFADQLRRAFRQSDLIGRLGGDEFVVLLVDASAEQCDAMLDRLRQGVDAHNAQSQRGYRLDFSAGAVAFDSARHAGIADLLAQADQAMYANKQARKAGTPPAGRQ
ncbi:sensor domain-containing diguanylate cyclase [Cupriavidus gilardii]|uniref:GGDEF domain-containing protein n=1 Tax=Cupriavidus gilardii TaxID=82541 RepID=UPI0021B1F78A|nr:sensor domain-containing diguanylate cyclase [Cupriavidus gilardii]UXC38002.1 sensor domain-containing diguanylate cyclase [Cupriavidus gilardii]